MRSIGKHGRVVAMLFDLLVPERLGLAVAGSIQYAFDLAVRKTGNFRLRAISNYPEAMRSIAPAGVTFGKGSLGVVAEQLRACAEIVGIRIEKRFQASRFRRVQIHSGKRQMVWIVLLCHVPLRGAGKLVSSGPIFSFSYR